jgi:hypothetical protein
MAERDPRWQRTPVRPDRVRRVERGFAFVPNRFLHQGFFASLTHHERSLYFFLVLAGDRHGVSFYAYDRICSALEVTLDHLALADMRLIFGHCDRSMDRVYDHPTVVRLAKMMALMPLAAAVTELLGR